MLVMSESQLIQQLYSIGQARIGQVISLVSSIRVLYGVYKPEEVLSIQLQFSVLQFTQLVLLNICSSCVHRPLYCSIAYTRSPYIQCTNNPLHYSLCPVLQSYPSCSSHVYPCSIPSARSFNHTTVPSPLTCVALQYSLCPVL